MTACRFEKFQPEHVMGQRAHPTQAEYQWMLDDPARYRALWPDTLSAFDGGEMIACGGATLIDRESGGWILFTDKITPRGFLSIHRLVVRYLVCFEQINDPIFFAHINPDRPEAMRWAGLLGLDTQRTDVLPDGRRMLRTRLHVS